MAAKISPSESLELRSALANAPDSTPLRRREAAAYLGFSSADSLTNAVTQGRVPPPMRPHGNTPYWLLGTLRGAVEAA